MAEQKVYSVDIKIVGTLYVKAGSAQEALVIADRLRQESIELPDGWFGSSELQVSGKMLDDPDLPDVSLSPALSIHGPEEGVVPEQAWPDEEEDDN